MHVYRGIKKLLFLGSSCIYPKYSKQPIFEEELLSDYLEPTNEGYALVKISGIKMCEYISQEKEYDYRSIMPTNLYGPNDNYHLENSHVIPGLIHKFYNAKKNSTNVEVWGSGNPLREFLHVDDLAKAAIFVNNVDSNTYYDCLNDQVSHLNVGSGEEITIKDLANMISKIFNFDGKIIFDGEKPDGMKRKLLDSSRLLSLGWSAEIDLRSGLESTISEFKLAKEKIMNLLDQKICIVGMGYVGLPLAVCFGRRFKTIGYDIEDKRISDLRQGIDKTGELSKEEILSSENLLFSSDLNEIKDFDVYIIAVPTPIDEGLNPDLEIIRRHLS